MTSIPCWLPACSVTTGRSCTPATNEVSPRLAAPWPGQVTSIGSPKLMISGTVVEGTSRRRSGRGVRSR
jgi:hypothetical protein